MNLKATIYIHDEELEQLMACHTISGPVQKPPPWTIHPERTMAANIWSRQTNYSAMTVWGTTFEGGPSMTCGVLHLELCNS